MSRKAEIIITIIGMVMFTGLLGLSIIFLSVQGNPEFQQMLQESLNETYSQMEGGQTIDLNEMANMISSFTTYVLVASLIGVGLGGLSIFLLKGNKKPKTSGIILIVTAVIGTIATLFLSFFGGIAYLIAGIMALVRKPKVSEPEPVDV
ncbi:DUF4064 domain-containing protein [Pontibacillus yanchengensis]|uniref:DUF4064 domain-containing protein n=2 Tax=Pontibacillus yanchengensis TaxID=462910 RepID=A0A6I5A3S4_9BACI|nr:DUF4064 domain-containing protein [Pontibacillus yanchengensis]MYL33849.1 DUF4064 domain-containing protein [Pontibacillus yanchengensis]MYL53877.1 DUF4064 domain-containing protein [Pontibacillus yanchengensis]